MRIRILTALGVLILSFAAVSAMAADRSAVVPDTGTAIGAAAGDGAFPHVARDQHRPKPVAACSTCTDQPGIDTGTWDPDACNCVRMCKIDGLCYLGTSTTGCRSGAAGTCSDCSVNCG